MCVSVSVCVSVSGSGSVSVRACVRACVPLYAQPVFRQPILKSDHAPLLLVKKNHAHDI